MSDKGMSQTDWLWMLQAEQDHQDDLASERLIQLGGKILQDRPDCEYNLAQLRSLMETLNTEVCDQRADIEYVLEILTAKFSVGWAS